MSRSYNSVRKTRAILVSHDVSFFDRLTRDSSVQIVKSYTVAKMSHASPFFSGEDEAVLEWCN